MGEKKEARMVSESKSKNGGGFRDEKELLMFLGLAMVECFMVSATL